MQTPVTLAELEARIASKEGTLKMWLTRQAHTPCRLLMGEEDAVSQAFEQAAMLYEEAAFMSTPPSLVTYTNR